MAKSMFNLAGRVALVTGAARGLGFAMARALGEFGARLALFDIDSTSVQSAAKTLSNDGFEVLNLHGDVTNVSDVTKCIENVVNKYNSLDIVVNNAGIVYNAPAEEMSLKEWKQVIDVNLTGVFLVSQVAGRQMIKQKSGNIINIASMSGSIANFPQPQCAYNASKAGVILLTKSLASEWVQHNIRVNSISPGYMNTHLTAKGLQNPDYAQHWRTLTPMHRVGEPHELTGLVVFLASDASSYVTGSDILIDGGYTMR
ncbi:unnamed protein product [Rotaria sordida]|uniref:D-arabinitol 2-dehydrogenase [ribulose-forming] n=2 Tax=Rotaria sordida TaxID=392033 RepID=A0A814GS05_9BILA|nr:unnamed protein product [Rotaria sordida]CAF1013357.1 unnamed protein product [Rotaria sordida]CAF3692633.1 unnamed protein product [Rotaria sordida]CAF3787172.1 unnamed protein product [Rotaria sordida]